MIIPIYRDAMRPAAPALRRQLLKTRLLACTLTAERQSMEMRRSTTTTTTMLPILLCNVLPNPKTLSRGWSGGPASRGKGMDGLGQSPFAAVDLLSRVWIDNSMRHQNGRSRAAVASSLLLRLVSWSLLVPSGPF